jgi:hypothetical protein
MFCYNIPIDAFSLGRIQSKKGIILYYKTNRIMGLTKHVDVNHVVITTKIGKEMNSRLKGCWKKYQQKKELMCLAVQY